MEGDTDKQLCAEVIERGCYLLETAQYFDCKFLVGVEPHQEEIASHKLILALASPVFEAMFYGNLSEKSNPIHIVDIQPETFKMLIQYIYTGYVNMNSTDEVFNLYNAAKKYMLHHLLEECRRQVDTNNVWQVLEFAQFHEDKEWMLRCEKIFSMDTLNLLNNKKFEEAELNTVVTVFSYDNLNIDSEKHLIKAAARYAKAHNIRIAGRDVDQSPSDGTLTDMSSSEFTLNGDVDGVKAENSTDPVAETQDVCDAPKQLESGSQALDPGAPAVEESSKIKSIAEKIRFLNLTSEQFAECSERTSILTMSEDYAVILNIGSRNCNVPLPSHFSECTWRRSNWKDCSDEKDDSRLAGSFTYTVHGFTHLDNILSPPCYVRGLPWQLNVKKDEDGCHRLSILCSGLKSSRSCEVDMTVVVHQSDSLCYLNINNRNLTFTACHLFCRESAACFFSPGAVAPDIWGWNRYIKKDGSVKFEVTIKKKEHRK